MMHGQKNIKFFMPVRLSVCISAAPTGRIFVTVDIGELGKNLSINSKFDSTRTKNVSHITRRAM